MVCGFESGLARDSIQSAARGASPTAPRHAVGQGQPDLVSQQTPQWQLTLFGCCCQCVCHCCLTQPRYLSTPACLLHTHYQGCWKEWAGRNGEQYLGARWVGGDQGQGRDHKVVAARDLTLEQSHILLPTLPCPRNGHSLQECVGSGLSLCSQPWSPAVIALSSQLWPQPLPAHYGPGCHSLPAHLWPHPICLAEHTLPTGVPGQSLWKPHPPAYSI